MFGEAENTNFQKAVAKEKDWTELQRPERVTMSSLSASDLQDAPETLTSI
jgi:hypothetical protein